MVNSFGVALEILLSRAELHRQFWLGGFFFSTPNTFFLSRRPLSLLFLLFCSVLRFPNHIPEKRKLSNIIGVSGEFVLVKKASVSLSRRPLRLHKVADQGPLDRSVV